MFGGFFGEYLVQTGAVTAEQLSEAISRQRESNDLLGYLAIEHGMLSEGQLQSLLAEQVDRQEKLGVLAVENGLISAGQLDELLSLQARNHLYLGDALVRAGFLDREELLHYLDSFKHEIDHITDEISVEIDKLPDRELVYRGLDAVRSYFFRSGNVVKIIGVEHEIPEFSTAPALFIGTIRLKDNRVVYFGTALPEAVMFSLYRGNPDQRSKADLQTRREAIEYLEQTFYNLTYYICRELKRSSVRARHGVVRTSLPSGLSIVSFRLIGLGEPFYVIYASARGVA